VHPIAVPIAVGNPGLKTNVIFRLNLENNISEKGLVIYRGEDVIWKKTGWTTKAKGNLGAF
jgi:hypothetical protein